MPSDTIVIEFACNADVRGSLIVGENPSSLPFEVRRFFLVKDVPPGETRGDHAHRECHQFLICTHGQVEVTIRAHDDSTTAISLDNADRGLHIPPLVWAQQRYLTPDAMLLVFASHEYVDSDYIRDFEEYVALQPAVNAPTP